MNRIVTTVHFDPHAFDSLSLPGGRTVAEVSNIHSIIVDDLEILGTSHTQGKQELLQRYHDQLERIGAQGAEAAKANYLAEAAEAIRKKRNEAAR